MVLVDKAVWRPGSTTAIGLDNADFEQCLSSDRHLASIDSDAQEAQDAGITATPYFVLGETNGDTIEGTRIRGAQPFASFRSQIEALLAKRANE